MATSPVSLRLRIALAGIIGFASAAEVAAAAQAVRFDIPSEPLSDALYAFSRVTGIDILVPGDLLQRRRSVAVAGVLAPDQALLQLLDGTGLAPQFTEANAFTLVPAAVPAPTAAPRYVRYSGAMQAAVTDALCRFQKAQPGGYRLAAQLWVAPSGSVKAVKLLGTTGDADRDATVAALLRKLEIGEAPPTEMAQPTTLVIQPRAGGDADCKGSLAGVPQ